MQVETITLHPFELAGLGRAPFAFVSLTRCVFVAAPGCPAQPGTTCDFCGQGIMNVCNIQGQDGKRFKVGVDCVRKLQRSDNRLVSEVNRAEALRQKAVRDQRAAEQREQRRKETERKTAEMLEEQRRRNGGRTDAQVAAERARLEAVAMGERNQWILSVLRGMSGDFVAPMADKLTQTTVADLSPRCVQILREIYGKEKGGRRGSKAYDAAADEFDRLAGLPTE